VGEVRLAACHGGGRSRIESNLQASVS
jgi:hypothetical protein